MISFTLVAVVAAIALGAPLVPGLTGLGVPAIVLEILTSRSSCRRRVSGVILSILEDADEMSTRFGEVIISASIAEVGPIVLLSLFFSGESGRHTESGNFVSEQNLVRDGAGA